MALIGNWGDFTFYVSADQIKTFDSLKWDSAAKYSTHDRHLREPLLEYTGTDVETITFTMFFSVFLGVNPIKEIASLLQAMRRGEVNRLVIGPKAYGTNKWVITKLSNSLKRFDRWGNLLVASVNVTMQSYAVRKGGREMAYIVKAFTPGKLNLAPETLEEEVLQNVAIIVSTPKFSVPLDRGLGLAQRFIDKPIQVAQSILISEVLDAVEEYEPRAEVTNVTFEAGETPGLLVPVLEVNIVDNEE